jgi:hypothetical protein
MCVRAKRSLLSPGPAIYSCELSKLLAWLSPPHTPPLTCAGNSTHHPERLQQQQPLGLGPCTLPTVLLAAEAKTSLALAPDLLGPLIPWGHTSEAAHLGIHLRLATLGGPGRLTEPVRQA